MYPRVAHKTDTNFDHIFSCPCIFMSCTQNLNTNTKFSCYVYVSCGKLIGLVLLAYVIILYFIVVKVYVYCIYYLLFIIIRIEYKK